ncbi:MAG TPA: LmeA family phospholipid-binding protein [Fimbriimonas sp.]|nr:LmeA family phospholipid-binding protein [Fimbriimonas sp.]
MPENHIVDVGFIQANFRDLVLPMGLRVDTVKISADGLHFETEPFLATVKQPGTFEVFVSDASLSEFLNKKTPGNVKKFRVTSKNGKLDVQASVVMLIELPATAICTLRIVEQRYLYVDLESVNVMGAGATSLVQSQLEKINPVLDVEEFPVRASLNRVDIVEGGVLLLGTVAPP